MPIKRTLLKLVQDVLVTMDGDEVTTITETIESKSVASIIEQCYYRIISKFDLPETKDVVSIDEDVTAPVLMSPNVNSVTLSSVKYNVGTVVAPNYIDIDFVDNVTFFSRQLKRSPVDGVENSSFNYVAATGSSVPIIYGRKAHPSCYTTLKDGKLVFDSYDSSVDARILETKTFAFGDIDTAWTSADAFVPPLDGKLHQLLLEMAVEQSHTDLKQMTNERAKRDARMAGITARKEQHDMGAVNPYYKLPGYGRK
jgi:hypothetical protein